MASTTISSASLPSGACIKCLLSASAVASALCISGPALYWRFKKRFATVEPLSTSSAAASASG